MSPELIADVAKRMGWQLGTDDDAPPIYFDNAITPTQCYVECGEITDSGIVALLEWTLRNEHVIAFAAGKYRLVDTDTIWADSLAEMLCLARCSEP